MDISTKEKKVKLVITIILGVFIIYASIYILLFNFLIPKTDKEGNENVTLTVEEQKMLSDLVPYIKNTISDGTTGAYDVSKVDGSNINSIVLFNMAYDELEKDKDNFVDSDSEAFANFKSQYCKTDSDKCFMIYRAALNSVISRSYQDITFEWTDFQIKNNSNDFCKYINGEYFCHTSVSEEAETVKKVSQIVLSKVDEENYYIYEKALFLTGYSEVQTTDGYTVHAQNIYKYYRNDNYSFNEHLDITSSDGNYTSELIKKYDNVVQIFKSTFKKNRNGNYYWVSTEPVSVIGE